MAMRIAATMGTTYVCKSFFSKLKIVKSKHQNRLIDKNVTNEFRCVTIVDLLIELLTSKNWVITFKSKCHIEGTDGPNK